MENRKGRLFLVMLFAIAASLIGTGAFAGIDKGAVDKCKTCHEEVVNKFLAGSHHGKVWQKGDEGKQYSCETCHGPGDKHMEDNLKTSIISFGKKSAQTAAEQSKMCLSCHNKAPDLAFWDQGKHKRNDVSCASCHTAHDAKPQPANVTETCLSCHKDTKVQLGKQSHHPILEGKVSCNDCHNPHGALSHGMIRADNNNQLCYKCHADKRGPYMWEHDPVEENCNNCHTSHGSQHKGLLKERGPNLCQNCHTEGSHPTTIYSGQFGPNSNQSNATKLIARNCLNCHPKIHGSNAPHNPASGQGYNSGKFFTR